MATRITLLGVLLAHPLLAGDLADRFELTFERVLNGGPPRYDESFLLADVIPQDVRRFTNFSGDLSGRYVGALAMATEYQRDAIPSLEELVFKILRHQKEDGHFGNRMSLSEIREDDMARLWGNGRLLIGLLEYYRTNPRPEVLQAARRIGDFLVSVASAFNSEAVRRHFSSGRFAVGYICWTQNIEGLVELYQRTSDDRYLTLAKEMAARTARRPKQHSHGFLTSLRGILALAQATREEKYLAQVEKEWQGIVESENLLVHGAVPEAFAPGIERDEGCSEADWLRLSLALWKETGRRKYLEGAEKTLFNAFFMNQFPSGDFGHFRLSETGLGYGVSRAWWCCTLHGLRAFPDVFEAVFRAEGSALYYDLPADGRGEAGGMTVEAVSSIEREGTIGLRVVRSDGESYVLAVRAPAWAERVAVSVNGEAIAVEPSGEYLRIKRRWKADDSVRLQYSFLTRIERNQFKPGYVSVFHGPWLLAVSEASTPYFFDELQRHHRVLLPESLEEAGITLESAQDLHFNSGRFTVPIARREMEWIPAGHPQQRQTAALRALAEHTSTTGSAQWQFRFIPAGEAGRAGGNAAPGRSRWSERWIALLFVAAFAVILLLGSAWRRAVRSK